MKYSSKLIVLFMCISCSVAFANGVSDLNNFLTKKNNISADFIQRVTSNKKSIKTISGEMQISRPNKFKWKYLGTDKQVIYSDGVSLSIYDVALKQVTIKKLNKTLTGLPAQLLAGGNNIKGYYTLMALPDNNSMELVQLHSKSKVKSQAMNDITLGFNKKTKELAYMKLIDSFGNVSELFFSNLNTKASFPANNFTFIPPAGVDVINSAI